MPAVKSFKQFIKSPISEAVSKPKDEKYVNYDKKILIIGYGSVGQCILPLVLRHIVSDPKLVTVLEKDNHSKIFRKRNGNNGVKYIKKEILRDNLEETLAKYTEPGGFVIDVSLNIGALDIIEWCLQNDVMYTNTSLERWADQPDETIPKLEDRTLHFTHKTVRKMVDKYPNAATTVATHGANPGLVTHFTKRALLELARKKGKTIKKTPETQEEWAQLMKKLGVKVVHIAERDTQVIDEPKKVGEFTNSWSAEGFWAEGRAPAEMGWGTHEPEVPENGVVQGNQMFLKQPGVSVLMKSWVPTTGPYNGFLIQHSEAITMSDYFCTEDGKFRPTVHYVYQPTDTAIASVHELMGRELEQPVRERIIKDEIISGMDELGVLLIGDDFAMWHGSQLTIQEARKLVPGENATSIQVAATLLGGIVWAIYNSRNGYTEPESIPFEFVLQYADPYLGKTPFVMTDWRPDDDRNSLFHVPLNTKVPCAFKNFRVLT